MRFKIVGVILLMLGCGAAVMPEAHASIIQYDVTFSSLGTLAGSSDYNLDFQLIPTGTANSSTTLNFGNFTYGGGSGPAALGPLTDAGTVNETFRSFTVGNTLSFRITANYTAESPNPDVLSFGLFSGTTNMNTTTSTTPTKGSATGNGFSYFTIAFDGTRPTVNTYAGTNPAFAAPTVTALPEPSTYTMMAIGIAALGLVQWRRKPGQRKSATGGAAEAQDW